MIYHIQTYCTYGYWSEDLAPRSHKPIIVACDKCGKLRIISKDGYRDLCKSCAIKKRFEDPKEREKTSKGGKKRFKDNPVSEETLKKMSISAIKDRKEHPATDETRNKLSEAATGRKHSDETCKKMSVGIKKQYDEMDDPGQQIVGHHIAYDFDRPEVLTVEITRSFHAKIHNPKGQGVHEHGYSLID